MNNRRIVIGMSSQPAGVILQPCHDTTLIKRGIEQPCDGALGKILAALQGPPDLHLPGNVRATKLMEVQIKGDLVRAPGGIKFPAIAVGENGMTERAKLLDPTNMISLVDMALVWRLVSIVASHELNDH